MNVKDAQSLVIAKQLQDSELTMLGLLPLNQSVIDLLRVNGQALQEFEGAYQGICC
jgi:hypothetical protein